MSVSCRSGAILEARGRGWFDNWDGVGVEKVQRLPVGPVAGASPATPVRDRSNCLAETDRTGFLSSREIKRPQGDET